MILHTVNKSPFGCGAYACCLRNAGDNDAVLLIEDGVYAILKESPSQPLYALQEDIEARGLTDKVPQQITLVDYSGFVKLATEADAIQSWY